MNDLVYDEDEVAGSMNFEHAPGSIEVAGYAGQWPVVNGTSLSDETIMADSSLRELARSLSRWVDNARAAAGRSSLYDPGAYTPPDNWYAELRAARRAMETDDIVQGVHEITEAFAFQGLKWEGEDPDVADCFNQVSRDVNLDRVAREMWWEEFHTGQFVAAMQWGRKTYRVRGRTAPQPEEKFESEQRDTDPLTGEPTEPERPRPKGRRRRKTYDVYAPHSIHVLDSACVVPVMQGPLGSDALAWHLHADGIQEWERAVRGERIDPEMIAFYLSRYTPDQWEEGELVELGVDPKALMLLNPQMVFRHTGTRPGYKRFASMRMKSLFRLLDMKQQLLASDRASLVGAANYILLVKKGSEKQPASPAELANLNSKYQYIARMPVIISDHRLEIEIVSPKVDLTLNAEKYDTLDTRILARLLGTLTFSSQGQRNETNVTLARAVARGMENRRHMLKRRLEERFARAIIEHPNNKGIFDGDEPNLVFVPRTITLDVDQHYIEALLALRTQRELSRETILEVFGLDQAAEAQRLEIEEELYDDVFKTLSGMPGMPGAGVAGGVPAGPLPSQTGRAGGKKATAVKAPAKAAPAKKSTPAKATS